MNRMIFHLPFPPSVNSLWANNGKRRWRTQKYDSWIQEAGTEIMRLRPRKTAGPVTLFYEFQEPRDKRKHDVGNLEKAVTDLLVSHQIIEADDQSIVREIRLKWSPDVGGVRVTVASAYFETSTQGQPYAVRQHSNSVLDPATSMHGMRRRS